MTSVTKYKDIIINVLFYTVTGILIICLSSILISRFTDKYSMPKLFNFYVFKVASGSMRPNLKEGDYIIVKKNNNYKKGDIVTFIDDGYVVTHRIIRMDGDKVITMGDANNSEDEEITTSDIIGKYVKTSALLGFVISCRFVIIILCILFYMIWKTLDYIFAPEEEKKGFLSCKGAVEILTMDEEKPLKSKRAIEVLTIDEEKPFKSSKPIEILTFNDFDTDAL